MEDANWEKSRHVSRHVTRHVWGDLFRGIAVLWMIETHVSNTFLDWHWLGAKWFEPVNYANGLVAPAFLFISGLLQGLSCQRAGATPGGCGDRPPQGGRKRLIRIGQLLGLAYALHFSLPRQGDWVPWLRQIDILQCIGVSMLVGLVLQRAGTIGIGLGACFFVFAAPFAGTIAGLPDLVAGYVNRLNGSLFPLFPWAGFFLAGWCCRGLSSLACLGGAAVCWAGVFFQRFLPGIYPPHEYYLVGPGFFFERLGWMLAGLAACQWGAGYLMENPITKPVAERVVGAGRTSLAIYAIHLQVINLFAGIMGLLGMPQRVNPAMTALLLAAVAALSLKLTDLLALPRVAPACRWLGVRPASA